LQKIKARTHRGLRERHLAGFSAGGRTYGYTSVAVDPADPETRWNKAINPETAEWVVWIFEQYANGLGGKGIASELNRLGVPSPGAGWKRTQRRTDGKWQHSAILGMASRASGILRNELYVGRVVWNRSKWVKRPGTGTRSYRLRPKEQWIVEEHPELRIVSDELWHRVQARLSNARNGGAKGGRKGTYLLTGILKCLDCGGSLTMIDQRCYGCGTRNRGGDSACDNPVRIRRVHLEERFLQNVREQLLDEKTVRWAEKEVARRLAAPAADTGPARRELAQVEGDLVRVVDAIAKMGFSNALESKLAELEARKHTLLAELQAAERTIQLPDISAITAKWRAVVENVGNLPKMATPPEVETARRSLKSLLGTVRVDRTGKGFADLSLHVPTNVVAGAGFEPATFGL
jgi:site-specific DNA recombinase